VFDGTLDDHSIANLLPSVPLKEFENLSIFDEIMKL